MIAWLLLLLVGAVFVAVWLLWAQQSADFATALVSASDLTQAGLWGDSFGGFNALMGALGFCGIIATLMLQTISLGRQQRDLHVQRFEQSFFELLRLVRESRDEVRFKYSASVSANRGISNTSIASGRDAFRQAYYEGRYWIEKVEARTGASLEPRAMGRLYARRIHVRFESSWGVYYRLLHATLDRIDTDRVLLHSERIRYANMLRGQLTSFEVSLAGLNALAPFAGDFQYLIVRYRLLKYARSESFMTKVLRRYYPKKAFMGRKRLALCVVVNCRSRTSSADVARQGGAYRKLRPAVLPPSKP